MFKDLSFSVKEGEFLAIFGPNDCGKTTLLNIIAGLDKDFEGRFERDSCLKTSFIFQNYRESLFPWLTVGENIGFPLSLQKISKENQQKSVTALCEKFSIDIDLTAFTYVLSGGQQQLISILRALITQPNLLLMDEPFSALDYETTLFLLQKLQEIWQKTGVAIIFISHEVDEALLLAEKIMILGRHPTKIIREVTNSLTYPRSNNIMRLPAFHETKSNVLEAFLEGCKSRYP